ncbi:MAG: hypothetical protein AB1755_03070 [Candidatus Omnitrophota bacterium]
MRQRNIFLIFAFYFLIFVFLTGCEAFRKKFVRKQAPRAPEKAYYVPTDYPKRPGDIEDEYNEYFTFWKRSQEELIAYLSGYYKKQIASSRRAIENLTYMRDMLKEEKAAKLTEYIKQMDLIHEEIKESHGFFMPGKSAEIAGELSVIYNDVRKNYPYKKIKDFLK